MAISTEKAAWHRPDSYVTARSSKTLRLAVAPAWSQQGHKPKRTQSDTIRTCGNEMERMNWASHCWRLSSFLGVTSVSMHQYPWQSDLLWRKKPAIWVRLKIGYLIFRWLCNSCVSLPQTQHRRWSAVEVAVLPALREPHEKDIDGFVSIYGGTNGHTKLTAIWQPKLQAQGLTLFLLKRPSEMMMLIWPGIDWFKIIQNIPKSLSQKLQRVTEVRPQEPHWIFEPKISKNLIKSCRSKWDLGWMAVQDWVHFALGKHNCRFHDSVILCVLDPFQVCWACWVEVCGSVRETERHSTERDRERKRERERARARARGRGVGRGVGREGNASDMLLNFNGRGF